MLTLSAIGKTLLIKGWDNNAIQVFYPRDPRNVEILTFTCGFPSDLAYQLIQKDITHIHNESRRGFNSEWGIIDSVTMDNDTLILKYHFDTTGSPLKADDYDAIINSGKAMTRTERLFKRMEDPEVKEKLKNWRDIILTDIEHIRVCPAAQKDELAIEIASKDGKKPHLLVKGHYA